MSTFSVNELRYSEAILRRRVAMRHAQQHGILLATGYNAPAPPGIEVRYILPGTNETNVVEDSQPMSYGLYDYQIGQPAFARALDNRELFLYFGEAIVLRTAVEGLFIVTKGEELIIDDKGVAKPESFSFVRLYQRGNRSLPAKIGIYRDLPNEIEDQMLSLNEALENSALTNIDLLTFFALDNMPKRAAIAQESMQDVFAQAIEDERRRNGPVDDDYESRKWGEGFNYAHARMVSTAMTLFSQSVWRNPTAWS